MPPLGDYNPNLSALKALYQSDPVAKIMLDDFSLRRRGQTSTKLDSLLLRLSNAGNSVQRSDAIRNFRKLEEFGYGRFVEGRKGHPSRFEWQYDLETVGKAATGEAENVQPASVEVGGVDDDAVGSIEHPYQLRPDWQVRIILPADLTAREAVRLGDFIRTLPFDSAEM